MSPRRPQPNPYVRLNPSMEGIRFLDETAPTQAQAQARSGDARNQAQTQSQATGDGPSGPGPATPPREVKPGRRRREWPIGVLSFLAVVGVGLAVKLGGVSVPVPTTVEEAVARSFEVGEAPRIEVETFNGPVEVIRGEPGEVRCRVEKRSSGLGREAAEVNVSKIGASISREGETIRVVVLPPEDWKPSWNAGASVTVLAPEGAAVRLKTRNGAVKVRGVKGPVEARSSNGPMAIQDASGIVSLETSNGRIECGGDGLIVDAETSNGAIEFRGSLAPGLSSFETSNGPVTLRLPEDQVFRLDARTTNGSVASEFDLKGSPDARPALLVGDFGDRHARSATVKVRSSNGSVRVEKED